MADIIEKIKRRVAYHSNNHRYYYELGKGVLDCFANDLLADFSSCGYVRLALKPGDSVWYASNKVPVEYVVHFVGINSEYTFYNCHKKTSEYASDRSFDECQIGKTVFLTKEEAEAEIQKRKIKEAQNGKDDI